ncbi:MAG: DUF1573 domain-containing protein [Bacteroidales bacterium]
MKIKNTEISVDDSDKDYGAIRRGEILPVQFVVTNVGNKPLIIEDIITSCGCIKIDKRSIEVVNPGLKVHLKFIYDTSRNMGYLDHIITIYGNIAPKGKYELKFHVNIVAESYELKEYEDYVIDRQYKLRYIPAKDRDKDYDYVIKESKDEDYK